MIFDTFDIICFVTVVSDVTKEVAFGALRNIKSLLDLSNSKKLFNNLIWL